MNDKMELEEAIKIYNELKKHKEIIGSIDTDFFFKFAETVLQALEEVTEERDDYRSQLNGAFNNGFIPKKKIEDKINELKENIPYLSKFNDWKEKDYTNEDILENIIQVLQELLEDK